MMHRPCSSTGGVNDLEQYVKNPMFMALQKTRIAETRISQGALQMAIEAPEGLDINIFEPLLDTSGVDLVLRVEFQNYVEVAGIAVCAGTIKLDTKRFNSIRRVAQRHGNAFFFVCSYNVKGDFAVFNRQQILSCVNKTIRPQVFVKPQQAIELMVEEIQRKIEADGHLAVSLSQGEG